jgi:hypothetical protein
MGVAPLPSFIRTERRTDSMQVQCLVYYLWYCWWFNNDSIQPSLSLVGVSLQLPIQRQQQQQQQQRRRSCIRRIPVHSVVVVNGIPSKRTGRHPQAAISPSSTMLSSSITSSGSSSSSSNTMDHLSCTHDGGEHWQLQDVSYVLPRGASTYMYPHTHTHTLYCCTHSV